jgi:hypothetical protein
MPSIATKRKQFLQDSGRNSDRVFWHWGFERKKWKQLQRCQEYFNASQMDSFRNFMSQTHIFPTEAERERDATELLRLFCFFAC